MSSSELAILLPGRAHQLSPSCGPVSPTVADLPGSSPSPDQRTRTDFVPLSGLRPVMWRESPSGSLSPRPRPGRSPPCLDDLKLMLPSFSLLAGTPRMSGRASDLSFLPGWSPQV